MHWLAAALLALATAFSCSPKASPTATVSAPIIVAFGDSLTSGPGLKSDETYPAVLQQRIAREGFEYRVISAGVAGDTTTEALRRFDQALVPDTRILILAIGINDGLRGVPVATVERNISTMIERAQARGARVLLCAMEAPPFNGLGYSIDFHRMFTRLAERHQVPLVPFFLIGLVGNNEFNLNDTLHPNAEGHKVIAQAIWPYLRQML